MTDLIVKSQDIIDRILTLELVRVTERAAVSAARLRGRGDEKAADQAAVDAMRRELNRLPIDGEVVIGEGERDEAPMLFIGEKVGTKLGPKVDIAVDPLEDRITPVLVAGTEAFTAQTPLLVVGSGPGGGEVRTFDPSRSAGAGADQPVLDLFPFGSSFTGGVNVATADLTGDGTPDVIAGMASGGSQVKVLDGKTGAELHSFTAFEASFTGGVNVAAGKLAGDAGGWNLQPRPPNLCRVEARRHREAVREAVEKYKHPSLRAKRSNPSPGDRPLTGKDPCVEVWIASLRSQ